MEYAYMCEECGNILFTDVLTDICPVCGEKMKEIDEVEEKMQEVTESMGFDEYQEKANRTDMDAELSYYFLKLAGETGELVDEFGKDKWHGHERNEEYYKDELGDVLWYISVITDKLGLSLSEVADNNIDKLKKRYPNGFSAERSRRRDRIRRSD